MQTPLDDKPHWHTSKSSEIQNTSQVVVNDPENFRPVIFCLSQDAGSDASMEGLVQDVECTVNTCS